MSASSNCARLFHLFLSILLAVGLSSCGAPKDPALRLYDKAQEADELMIHLQRVDAQMLPVERMQPMLVLSLNLAITNEGEEPFAATSSELSMHALTYDKRQVLAPYFQAFQEDVTVPPGETVTDTIRFLIQPEQIDKQLILSLRGQQEWIVKLPGEPQGMGELGQNDQLSFSSPNWSEPQE